MEHKKRVFISWSGSTSQQVALALAEWLRQVNQFLDPWLSKDMERGVRWMDEISKALENTDSGIICLTPQNKRAPWIHFEAGALSKRIQQSRVCPCLFQMSVSDLEPPLGLLNATEVLKKDEMLILVRTLNGASAPMLEDVVLERSFEMWWPTLQAALERIPQTEPVEPAPSEGELLKHILDGVNRIERDVLNHRHATGMGPTSTALTSNADDGSRPTIQVPSDLPKATRSFMGGRPYPRVK